MNRSLTIVYTHRINRYKMTRFWLFVCFFLNMSMVITPTAGQNLFEILSFSNSNPRRRSMESEFSGGTVVELDILLNEDLPNRTKRAALRNERFYWRDNLIRFEIDRDVFDSESEAVIRSAIADWSNYTCIEFEEGRSSNDNYLLFTSVSNWCLSSVGSKGETIRNDIYLGPWCRKEKHVVLHELGHTIGLYHEHTRPDRDEHVQIVMNNIVRGKAFNFAIREDREINSRSVPYDYKSIMHYEKNAWSVHRDNVTIRTRDQRYQDLIGTARELSFGDIKVVNLMYNCDVVCSTHDKARDCPGEGFVGKDCRCWCPSEDSVFEYCDACPVPESPRNGSKQGSAHTVGSTVTFSCNSGYLLEGASDINCVGNGQWDAAVPTCVVAPVPMTACADGTVCSWMTASWCRFESVRSSCPKLCNLCTPVECEYPAVENGGPVEVPPFRENTAARFVCLPGYSLSGSSSSVCTNNNNLLWDPPLPACHRNCEDPGSLQNGQIVGLAYTYGSTVDFTCDEGYSLAGATSITCGQNGRWSAAPPACELVSCPDPVAPSNGRFIGTSFTFGSTVTFECNIGYNMVGSSSVQCQSNGVWDSTAPTCILITEAVVNCDFDNGFCGYVVFSRWELTTTNQGKYAVFRQTNNFLRAIMKSPDFNQVNPQRLCLKFRALVENTQQGRIIVYDQHFRQLWNSRDVIRQRSWQQHQLVLPPGVTSLYFVALNYYASLGHIGIDDIQLQAGTCDTQGVCTHPGVPQAGDTVHQISDKHFPGSLINYYCHPGYYPLTPTMIKCLSNGRWDGPAVYCRSGQNAQPPTRTNTVDPVCDDEDTCIQLSQGSSPDYIQISPTSTCCLPPLQPGSNNVSGHCANCIGFCINVSSLGESCESICGCGSDTSTSTTTGTTTRATIEATETTQTIETTTTTYQAFETTAGDECSDIWEFEKCKPYTDYGFCSDAWVTRNCQQSCGYCSQQPSGRRKRDTQLDVEINTADRKRRKGPCEDEEVMSCSEWSARGGCKIPSIRKQCRRTCKLCH